MKKMTLFGVTFSFKRDNADSHRFELLYFLYLSACDLPLGMEDNRIEDNQITQSQTKIQVSSPHWGRLNWPYGWCANMLGYLFSNAFIQIDFHKAARITAIETQGSKYDRSWVTQYSLKYKQSGNKFVWYKENYGQKVWQFFFILLYLLFIIHFHQPRCLHWFRKRLRKPV